MSGGWSPDDRLKPVAAGEAPGFTRSPGVDGVR